MCVYAPQCMRVSWNCERENTFDAHIDTCGALPYHTNPLVLLFTSNKTHYITNFICTVESKHAVRLRRVQQTNMQRDQINDSLYRLISQLHAYTNAPQPGSKLIFLPDFSIWSGISLDVMTIMKKWKLATFYELSCIFMRFFRISSGF